MFRKQKEPSPLDAALEAACINLAKTEIRGENAPEIAAQIVKLYELRQASKPKPISRDALLLTAANLTGIIMILAYENTHVIAGKAISQVPRLLR